MRGITKNNKDQHHCGCDSVFAIPFISFYVDWYLTDSEIHLQ